MLSPEDEALRGLLTRMIAERGFAPTSAELAERAESSVEAVETSLRRLHEAHALLLHPHACRPWVVHPFSLSPGACWVQTPGLGYWATCLYCAFGIAAALESDAIIAMRIGGEAEPARYRIRDGAIDATSDIFHFSMPPARWWDNVIHACATFQPFHNEGEVDRWCARHALQKGAIVAMPALWDFARDWYGGYLREPWRRRTPQAARALFARHGFTSDFWTL